MNSLISKLRIFLKRYMPKVYNSTLPLRNFLYKNIYLKKSDINIIETFEEFAPNVSGDVDLKIENTIYNIKNFTSSLDSLINLQEEIIQLNNLAENSDTELSTLLQEYGSDKKALQYDLIYSKIFNEIKDFTLLIEIGIGTNNEDILSNMSKFGKPGASLRAFRDYLQTVEIVGLEYDKTVLFEEAGIKTFYYDQNDNECVESFSNKYFELADILIDDGLHSLVANINSINLASKILKPEGYLIIEDISLKSVQIYITVFKLVENLFTFNLYTNNSSVIAVLKKISQK